MAVWNDKRANAVVHACPSESDMPPTAVPRQHTSRLIQEHHLKGYPHRLPFSWPRCLVTLVSYGLFLSDVPRAGLGVHDFGAGSPVLEPDLFGLAGPFQYGLIHLTAANSSTDGRIPYWPYKYDSTSQGMRAVAKHLKLPTWSPCVLYDSVCDETLGLPLADVFAMLDSLVEGIRDHPSSDTRTRSGSMTLRVSTAWYARLYDYALPWLFTLPHTHTFQAVYYNSSRHPSARQAVCRPGGPQPYICEASWTNFHRYAHSSALTDKTLWARVARRSADLKRAYLNHTLEMVLLNGQTDVPSSGYVFQGAHGFETIALARVQQCDPHHPSICTTVAIDDYRMETYGISTNIAMWFTWIAILRIAGQVYAWIRVSTLFVGCYFACYNDTSQRDLPWWKRGVAALRLVGMLPSQVVIYGSLFPIICYATAHILDSVVVSIRLGYTFVSPMGLLRSNIGRTLLISAVTMRSVWLVALACHFLCALSSRRLRVAVGGILGTPEFLITVVASANLFAQIRTDYWRDCRVLDAYEVIPSSRRILLRALRYNLSGGVISSFLSGISSDVRCIMCSSLLVSGIAGQIWILQKLFPRVVSYHGVLVSWSLVPYSANTLWPANTLTISWFGSVFKKTGANFLDKCFRLCGQSPEVTLHSHTQQHEALSPECYHALAAVDTRCSFSNVTVFAINLTAMTDPVTLLRLRVFRGRLIGVFESRRSLRRICIPVEWTTSTADTFLDWKDLRLLVVVSTTEMQWQLLLNCG